MQIIIDSLLIHYTDIGQGPVVLLLHGWADRLETFQQLLLALTSNYRVVALDLPGFGRSQPPAEAWNLDNYAQVVSNFLRKLEIPELEAVVGHSNGGAVAIRGLSLGALRARKLILLSSAGVRTGGGPRRLIIKLIAKTGKALTIWLPRSTRARLQKKLYGTVGSDMLITPELVETFKRTVRQDIQADARRLQLPTLLIYGREDKATPVSVIGEPLHRLITGSRLEIVPGADHFVHQAQPETVNRLIQEFLAA